jgi:hypothetical protein
MFITTFCFGEWTEILFLNQVFLYKTLPPCVSFWIRIIVFLQMLKFLFKILIF